MIVSSEGYTEIVKLLLSKPNIEINCKDILTINIHEIKIYFFNHIQIYNHFWNSIQIINWTALMFASVYGCTEIVQLLLSKPNIEINTKNILYQNIHNIRIFSFSLNSNLVFS